MRDWRNFKYTWRTGLTPLGRFVLTPAARGFGIGSLSATTYYSGQRHRLHLGGSIVLSQP